MNRMASKGNQWVWTALTESLRGVQYPVTDIRKAGHPVYEWFRQTVPASWVEKGYVAEAPIKNVQEAQIEGQLILFDAV